MAREFVAAAHLSVDAALFVMRLLGIESLPGVLALMDNVFNEADQRAVDDVTVPILVGQKIIDLDGRVNPTVQAWMRVLECPDIEVDCRAVNGLSMRRIVVARRGEEHVMAVRRGDEVVVQGVWSQGAPVEEVVAGPVWAALRPACAAAPAPSPAQFEAVTVDFDRVEVLAGLAPGDMVRQLRRELGVDAATARLLNEVSQYHGQRAEIVMVENRGIESVRTSAGVMVADTSMGRVVSSVRRSGPGLVVTYGPGSHARFKAAMVDLVGLTPSRDWFGARPDRVVAGRR